MKISIRVANYISRVRTHLEEPESSYRKILFGFIWVSVFVFIGKVAGAVKEIAIAWRYGISETVDAYVMVYSLINWPVSVWFSVLTAVLVPLLARYNKNSTEDLSGFRRESLGLALIVGFGIGTVAWFLLPMLLEAEAFGLADKTAVEAMRISKWMSLLAPFGMVIGLLSVWMLASGNHRNTLFESIPALVIIVMLFLPQGWVKDPLLFGTLFGFVMHMFALFISVTRRHQLQPPCFTLNSPLWHGVSASAGIMAVGVGLMSFSTIVDQLFAAQLGAGALSTLSYANKLLALILGLGAIGIGRATLPVFSEKNARVDSEVHLLAMRLAKWIFTTALAGIPLIWIISPYLIGLVFERGAFGGEDTEAVSIVFQYSLLQMPFYFAGLVLHSLMTSQRQYMVVTVVLALSLLVKLIFNFIFYKNFGLVGIQIASAVMYMFFCGIFFLIIFSKRVDINGAK